MKLINIIAFLSAAMAVSADSCNRGGVYCGTSLLNKGFSLMATGDYHDHIVAVLTGAGKSTDDAHVRNSIFNCLSGGEIAYQGYCTYGCGGTQSEDPDYCLPQY
ncbi:hypothetical protein TCE0_022f06756 [Talaromyces pinophilus]|uniref:Uncharacterized protein n=1 Tax=Talaromyces pinophilus TaxID=128442 RepID=A0A6V8H7N3_TALPI|nr:hypothetical protein TCE0_022f06756 [Talaromyces pinophilus]